MGRLCVSAGATAAAVLAFAAAPAGADSAVDLPRARTTYAAMQRYLFDPWSAQYRELAGMKAAARAWPFSQALTAEIEMAALLPGRKVANVPRRLRSLERRFRAGDAYSAWPGGDVYLDDNEWIAGAMLDWSELAGSKPARTRAAEIFALVARAWDGSAQHPCAGGIFWTQAAGNRDRNTVTTANAALLALRLYGMTRDGRYLAWSQRLLAWTDRCMLGDDGLYWDHIELGGAVDRTHWSYNQGLLIGALVKRYAVTGDRRALVRAETIADLALRYFGTRWGAGEPPEFAVVFFRQLLSLAAADGRTDYVDAAESYGERAWSTVRDPRTGLFGSGGRTRLLDQAAFVQLYAALARQGAVTAAP